MVEASCVKVVVEASCVKVLVKGSRVTVVVDPSAVKVIVEVSVTVMVGRAACSALNVDNDMGYVLVSTIKVMKLG